MTYIKPIITTLFIFTALLPLNIHASDIAKEKRWADQIVDSIMTGEAEWLQAGDHKFLSIYTESDADKISGGAIVIHGVGVHPNWAEIVQPLRTRLPETGWHTISLQMPVLPNEADYKDYAPLFPEIAPRIDAAVTFLKAKGVKNIAIIAHSMGATMAGYYVANNRNPDIKAFISIGANGKTFQNGEQSYIKSLKKINKPVLEIFGSNDLPGVLETNALKSKAANEAGNKGYRQINIKGANHFFVGKEDELVTEVNKWLGQHM